MQDPIATLMAYFQPTGDIAHDAPAFLALHGMEKAGHSAAVAAEARRLARRFGADPVQAEVAGWLHDISGIWPTSERVRIARALGVEVLPEEDAFPLILHQKLSVVVARCVFGVADEAVLSAIGCHTTLRLAASLLDKVVFLADKIAWDQAGLPPYRDAVQVALEESLDAAVFTFLDWQWQRREQLGVVHPWMVAAHDELAEGNVSGL